MHDIRFQIPDLDTRVPIMLYSAFGCLFKVEGRSMLLKTPHTYNTGLRFFKPDPTAKPPFYSLASIVLTSAMQPAKRGKQFDPAVILMNYNTDQHGKISFKAY